MHSNYINSRIMRIHYIEQTAELRWTRPNCLTGWRLYTHPVTEVISH